MREPRVSIKTPVAQTCSLSVSRGIVAGCDDCFGARRSRRFSVTTSIVPNCFQTFSILGRGSGVNAALLWLRLCRAVLYRRFVIFVIGCARQHPTRRTTPSAADCKYCKSALQHSAAKPQPTERGVHAASGPENRERLKAIRHNGRGHTEAA